MSQKDGERELVEFIRKGNVHRKQHYLLCNLIQTLSRSFVNYNCFIDVGWCLQWCRKCNKIDTKKEKR